MCVCVTEDYGSWILEILKQEQFENGSVYLKFWPSEFKVQKFLARRQFFRNPCETTGYEYVVVGNLAFLQVSLCGISTGPFISIS